MLDLALHPNIGTLAPSFEPSALFTGAVQGLAFDLTARSSLSQDSGGTVAVTASGDPIGRIADLSGRGNNATASGLSRPIWSTVGGRPAALFDGVDDSMVTASIDMSASDAVTVIAGMQKASDAAIGALLEFGPSLGFAQGFNMLAPAAALPNIVWTAAGTVSVALTATPYAAGNRYVVTGQMDISAPTNTMRINGSQVQSSAVSLGAGNLGNKVLYIGRRDGTLLPFSGYLTALIIINRILSPLELARAELWVNSRTGAY